ncbi:hypothetical protein GCK32_002206 [Trichostrongylus colubriformis]|uniref:G-protein coupled receptors family 1 profile domain-containing protein n=1 Tax=Trichostrongylus colubriformis TaxID=6319 RepID=A0AAN8FV62_TRICO
MDIAENGTEDLVDIPLQESLYVAVIEAGLLFLISCTGVACNLLAFSVMLNHPAFKNPFGYLASYYTFSNASALVIFVIWTVPWTIWNVPDDLQYLNLRMGQFALFFFEATIHCNLFISINRFIAITFPFHYRRLFTRNTTYGIIVFIFLIEALYMGVFFIKGCDFFYVHSPPGWSFGTEPCAQHLALYMDLYCNSSLILIFTCTDVVTIVQLKLRKKKIIIKSKTNAAQNREAVRERKEMMFAIQAALSSFTYAILLMSGFAFAPLTVTSFGLFLCTTLVWSFTHTAGGAIFVLFNPEIRRYLYFKSKSSSKSVTITNVREAPAVSTDRR